MSFSVSGTGNGYLLDSVAKRVLAWLGLVRLGSTCKH